VAIQILRKTKGRKDGHQFYDKYETDQPERVPAFHMPEQVFMTQYEEAWKKHDSDWLNYFKIAHQNLDEQVRVLFRGFESYKEDKAIRDRFTVHRQTIRFKIAQQEMSMKSATQSQKAMHMQSLNNLQKELLETFVVKLPANE
jgi:hypothetical protein